MPEKRSTLGEIKKNWVIFLAFGILSAAISAGVSTITANMITQSMQGPPCRIDFSKEKFFMNNSTSFNLQYLFINLRNHDLQIEGIDNYCVWSSQRDIEEEKSVIIEKQPITKDIPAPKELELFPSSGSEVKTAIGCISPNQEGVYRIKIIARTTSGSCEGNIMMEVVKG